MRTCIKYHESVTSYNFKNRLDEVESVQWTYVFPFPAR